MICRHLWSSIPREKGTACQHESSSGSSARPGSTWPLLGQPSDEVEHERRTLPLWARTRPTVDSVTSVLQFLGGDPQQDWTQNGSVPGWLGLRAPTRFPSDPRNTWAERRTFQGLGRDIEIWLITLR